MTLSNEFFVGIEGGNASPTYLDQQRVRTAGGPFMAQLGQYQFSLETAAFDQLKRATEFLWKGQNRIGRRPAQQFLGLGEDTITLQGTIYPHFRGGLGQLDAMRSAAGRGDPLALIYAFESAGQYVGLWCIKSITDDRSVFIRNGAARKIEFSMALVAYGEDEMQNAFVASSGPATEQDALQTNAIKVETLPEIEDVGQWQESAPSFSDAITGAVQGVTGIVATARGTIQGVIDAGKAALAGSGVGPALKELKDAYDVVDRIRRDTVSTVNVVVGSARSLKQTVSLSGIEMRGLSGTISSSAGKIESIYREISGSSNRAINVEASLSNALRAGSSMISAVNTAANQLEQISDKIKV